MSGDHLRLEGNKGWKICPPPRGFDQSNLFGGGEFDQIICPGPRPGFWFGKVFEVKISIFVEFSLGSTTVSGPYLSTKRKVLIMNKI